MINRSWAEVDLDALRENLAWIRDRVGPEVKVLTVVKADAYGHGLKQIAALLMQSGTDIFGVANLAEARAIRSVGQGWPILMLGACLPGEVADAVHDEVMPTISTAEEAQWFSRAAMRQRRLVRVHLAVDTGMGRLGVTPAGAADLADQIRSLPGMKLEGMFTHFASSEDDADFTQIQVEQFQQALAAVRARGIQVPLIHASNSGALLHERDALFNVVRPGLLVYGIVPPGTRRSAFTLPDRLRPALSWKSSVSLVKTVPRGVSLSYGRTYTTTRSLRVATVTVGYGDGYSRMGSNRAQVLIGGNRCRILGRVTMDQMLVDVSRSPEAKPGDEAVLIGQQGEDAITVTELATWFGTIPWEVLTGINHRVPRIYRGGTAA
jgi:alanine racemase